MRLIDADGLYIPPEEMNAKMAVAYAPTVEAEPVRHGKWLHPEEEDEDYGSVSCSCSVCGWKFNLYEDDIDGAPYCAMCGAKMEPVAPWYQFDGGKA